MVDQISDHELMYLVRENDEDAWNMIFKKYERLIYMIMHKHMHVINTLRVDREDVFQEGNLGLYDAILNYQDHLCMPLYPFAKVCIERRIQSLFRKYSSQSAQILRTALSLDQAINEEDHMYLCDVIPSPPSLKEPHRYVNTLFLNEKIHHVLTSCTCLEREIFNYRMQGYPYQWIAKTCNIKSKTIDNTMSKIKKALRLVI